MNDLLQETEACQDQVWPLSTILSAYKFGEDYFEYKYEEPSFSRVFILILPGKKLRSEAFNIKPEHNCSNSWI
jgi:hypothetical protein